MKAAFRVLLLLAALAASGLVCAMAATFYMSTADNTAAQSMYLGASLLSAFIKVAFPVALIVFTATWLQRAAAWLLVVCCILFDMLGVSGFVTMTRGAGVEARQGETQTYEQLRSEVKRLRTLADEMPRTRPTPVVAAELQAARAAAPNCSIRVNAGLDACQKLAGLDVEKAAADERDKREREWRAERDRLDKLPRPNEAAANPLATGVKPFADRLGIPADTLADVVVRVLLAVLLEAAPSLCSMFALQAAQPAQRLEAEAPQPDPPADEPEAPRRPPAAVGGKVDLLTVLEDIIAGRRKAPGVELSGAGVHTSARALARVASASPSGVNAALRTLQASGKVAAKSGPRGTYIELT